MRVKMPSMHELMDDPAYRAYMKRVPDLPTNLRSGEPWQVWMRTPEGMWRTKRYSSYRDAWPVFVDRYRSILENPGQDVTITSRRVFYAPPGQWYKVKVRDKSAQGWHVEGRWRQTWFWDDIRLKWCGRCRRPVHWQPLHDGHHALRKMPAISTEGNQNRCIICGIRDEATPDIMQMTRMEGIPDGYPKLNR